jgi:hypothetical protein
MNYLTLPVISLFVLRCGICKPVHEEGMHIRLFGGGGFPSFYMNGVGPGVTKLDGILYILPNVFDFEHHQKALLTYEGNNSTL